MTAATTTPVLRDPTKSTRFPQCILLSGQKVMQGWAAALQVASGKLVNLTAGLDPAAYRYVGTFTDAYDASATAPGGAGDVPCVIDRGREIELIGFDNDTVNPVLAANLGSQCYFLDNKTVCMNATGNLTAGIAWEFDANGRVLVEIVPTVTTAITNQAQSPLNTTAANFTGNDWAPAAADLASGTTYVIGSGSSLGANATLTLPSSGVAAGTSVNFAATGGQGNYTVTIRMGTTAITSALTGSKRWWSKATNVGDATTSIWIVDYTVDA